MRKKLEKRQAEVTERCGDCAWVKACREVVTTMPFHRATASLTHFAQLIKNIWVPTTYLSGFYI